MSEELNKYSAQELMICIAARLMEDETCAFIGTGIPMLAASLAKRIYAPNLIPVFEFGGIGATLDELPMNVGGARTFYKALVATGICDIMETAARGLIEYGFLGGAQIDKYGNLNTTRIGADHQKPTVRLPGSGGGNDVGSLCWKTISIMRHEKRRFVEKLDFMTTPGWLKGGKSREEAGLPSGTQPYRVVSNLALMGFDRQTKEMKLLATNPGVTTEEIAENTGFKLKFAEDIAENKPPTVEELKVLREEIDPDRIYI